ncbi:MAG TPA: paraquat-inducible protein A [Planctomycetota bacterium]|nr:paraquat-inducible protein A [Planctomycetota bacterium]
MTTALQAGLVSCHECGLLSRWVEPGPSARTRCPRCGEVLHRRKPNSLARTWSLLIAGFLLYIPANVLPVMKVIYAGRGEPDTIMSGVIVLFNTGQPAVAVLVLFASITVPMIKLLGLTGMAIATQRGSGWRRRDRTAFYRLVEFIGRWSMLDIFMISILVALVKLEALSTIEAGPGAVWFASVVVITMFAAASFDPRLAWDSEGQRS